MPSRSELPGGLSNGKFIRALERLGFIIDKSGGNGSHLKATWPTTQKCIVIQRKLRKDVLYYIVKQIEESTSVTWKDIENEL